MKTEIRDGDDLGMEKGWLREWRIEDLELRIHDRVGGRKDCFML